MSLVLTSIYNIDLLIGLTMLKMQSATFALENVYYVQLARNRIWGPEFGVQKVHSTQCNTELLYYLGFTNKPS